jgi:two-component system chemotaxis response regulator CheY
MSARLGESMKALIIDDDPISRLFFEEVLAPHASTLCTATGAEGVDAFNQALSSGNRFDAVLVDIRMPGMDGHQTLEKIRTLEREASLASDAETVVIMVSSLNNAQNVNRAFFQGGAMSFLPKPVDPEELLGELRKFALIG